MCVYDKMPVQILTKFLPKGSISFFDKHSNIETKNLKEKQVILAMLILVLECFTNFTKFTIMSLKTMKMPKFIELIKE